MCRSCGGNRQQVTVTKDGSTHSLAATLAPWIHAPYARYDCMQEQFIPCCRATPSPFEVCPENAANNCTTVVVACIPDFVAYIIDGEQGWIAAFVLFDIMII